MEMNPVLSNIAKDAEGSPIDAPSEDQLAPDKILDADSKDEDSDGEHDYGDDEDGKYKRYNSNNWAHKWTDEEDMRLIEGIERFGDGNWRQVACLVGTRDAVKCMQRWEKGLRPGIVKGRWSEDEDRMLVFLVSQGHKNWGKVAAHMPGRTSKQCRERWNNYLDPTLIHTPFTEEEDELLLKLQVEYGNKWALISRNISGRTENAVKLRFHALLKRSNGSGPVIPSANSAAVSRQRLFEASIAAQEVLMNKRQRLEDTAMYMQNISGPPPTSLSAEFNKNSFPSTMGLDLNGMKSSLKLPSASTALPAAHKLPSTNTAPFTDSMAQLLASQQQLGILESLDKMSALQQQQQHLSNNTVNVIPNPNTTTGVAADMQSNARNLNALQSSMMAAAAAAVASNSSNVSLEAAMQQQQQHHQQQLLLQQQQQQRADLNTLQMLQGLNHPNALNNMNNLNNLNNINHMNNKFMGFPQMNAMHGNMNGLQGTPLNAMSSMAYQPMAMHGLGGNHPSHHQHMSNMSHLPSGLADAVAMQNARTLQNLRALQNFQNIQNLQSFHNPYAAAAANRMPMDDMLYSSLQQAPPVPMMSGLMNLPPAFLQQQLQQQQLHALNPLMALNTSGQHDVDQQELNDSDTEK